jgi:hypothetical protein
MTVGASDHPLGDAGTRGFPCIKADSSSHFVPTAITTPLMLAPAVPRGRAISRRMLWNICRGTATSAIWT